MWRALLLSPSRLIPGAHSSSRLNRVEATQLRHCPLPIIREAQPTSSAGQHTLAQQTSCSLTRLTTRVLHAAPAGVCYFSRIPPFLKPDTLRRLLSGMGTEVLRIYLAPESHDARSGRVRAGGNKKKSFSEGWVEFEDKRRAKRIASTLNNTPMGGGNRSFYAHDLWNVKYLHRFKWSHLTEKMAYEARVKRDKMVAELTAAKKESAFYLRKVDQAKAIDAMEERKRKRAAQADGGGDDDAAAASKKRARAGASAPAAATDAAAAEGLQSVRRRFKQRRVARDASTREAQPELLDSLLRTKGGD